MNNTPVVMPAAIRDQVKYIQVQAYHYNMPVGSNLYFDDISVYATESPEVKVLQATADNGIIRARLGGVVNAPPTAGDFTVMQQVNGGELESIAIDEVLWNAQTKTATLKVPRIVGTALEEQTLQYSISYQGAAMVQTSSVSVLHLPDDAENLVLNPSFEMGDEGDWTVVTPPWYGSLTNPTKQSLSRTDFAHTNDYGLAGTGLTDMSSIMQYIEAEPGEYLAEVYYYVPESTTQGNILWYNVIMDAIGAQWIGTAADSAHSGTALIRGEWVKYSYRFTVNETYDGIAAGLIRFGIAHVGFKEGESIYYDDFALYKLND